MAQKEFLKLPIGAIVYYSPPKYRELGKVSRFIKVAVNQWSCKELPDTLSDSNFDLALGMCAMFRADPLEELIDGLKY